MAGQRGSPNRPPLISGGDLAEWLGGSFAAVGLMTSLYRTQLTDITELLDVSTFEAVVLNVAMYPMTWYSIAGTPWRPIRYRNLPDVHPTKDGFIGFMVVTAQQWSDFCVLVERPDWLVDEQLAFLQGRLNRHDELVAELNAWSSERTTDEILEMATLLRVPAAPVGNGQTAPQLEQLADRGFYIENPSGGFLQPRQHYYVNGRSQWSELSAAPSLGEHTTSWKGFATETPRPATRRKATSSDGPQPLPFEGIRVADFTSFWAGPIVGQFLGALGADVIHVESTRRPDGMRFNSVKPPTFPGWWEWGPLYQGTNTNKRGITIDLESTEGRDLALSLISQCDVVIDNYSPRVLERFGLTYEAIREVREDVVMLRAPAFGLTGPWRDRVGYGQTLEHTSGMAWVTGYPDEVPQASNNPSDPIAGTHSTFALLVALEHRRRTGEGCLVESPMIEAMHNVTAEQVIEFSAYGNLLNRMGNRHPAYAPQGIYSSADEPTLPSSESRWVAISVATDEQWRDLVSIVDPVDKEELALANVDQRRLWHDRIDEILTVWCGQRTSAAIVDTLEASRIPVARLIMPHEQGDIEQLQERGFFEVLDHPLCGSVVYSGYPVKFGNGPKEFNRSTPPQLGEHNNEVLSGLLGLTPTEIQKLEMNGVIGSIPDGASSAF